MFTLARVKPSRLLTVTVLLALCLGLVDSIARADHPSPDRYNPDRRLIERVEQLKTSTAAAGGQRAARSRNISQIGFAPVPGFNGDVWAHNGFAYVGTWVFGPPDEGFPFCPATGVRIIDLSNRSNPTLVGAVAVIPGTTQEDMVVTRIGTRFFHGDLLVTGIQDCFPGAPDGIDIWDVSNPRSPVHLAFWPSGAFGVHELYLFQRGNRAYVTAATPFSEFVSDQGDFRLVDVTDPRHPVQVGDWGLRDIGVEPTCENFEVFCTFAHSAWANKTGTMAILSYWDFGAVFLDISNPANPTFIGRTVYPAGADGDTHSIWLARGDNLLLTADEDFSPVFGPQPPAPDDTWGFLRVWDVKDPANPVQIGTFGTPNSLSTRADADFSIHNPFVRGNTAYLSWYADGVRVIDISQPSAPREIASFVPPPVTDVIPFQEIWGVYVDRDLILASGFFGGLYVLKHVP